MNFRTKPRDEQLSFVTSCWKCAGELTITQGRPDRHECRPRADLDQPTTLASIEAALDNR